MNVTNLYMNVSVFSLKTTSATRIFTDIDVPETWKLIQRYEMSFVLNFKF
jgi:hypothetical protein